MQVFQHLVVLKTFVEREESGQNVIVSESLVCYYLLPSLFECINVVCEVMSISCKLL